MKNLTKMNIIILLIMFYAQTFAQTSAPAVISLDKMKVFYSGIDNPITVAAPGVDNDRLHVIVKNGNITGSNGKYIVRVNEGSESVVEISSETKPGEYKKIGSETFKVKNIPDPLPCLGNNCRPMIGVTKEELLQNAEINAKLEFPFDVNFEVTSFSLVVSHGGDVQERINLGSKFTQKTIDSIKKIEDEKNTKLWIENIKCKGPDGIERKLLPIHITLVAKK